MNAIRSTFGRPVLRTLWGIVNRHRVLATYVFILVLPWLSPYKAVAANVLIYGLFALGFNLVYGYTGLLSFGHAALFGAGAYGCGIAIAVFHLPWYAALPAGVVLAVVVAAAVGALAIRTRGIYFAMVTLALAECVYYVFFEWSSLTGGENGLRDVNVTNIGPAFLHLNLLHPTVEYYFMAFFVGLGIWFFSRVLASPFGAVLEAIRENENRARASGYNVPLCKWLSFVLSGAFCGLAGALLAIHISVVPIEVVNYTTSGEAVMMTLLGGMGTFFGPFIGAAFYLLIQDVITQFTTHWQLFVGVIFMIFVLFFPRGIWGSLLSWLVP